MGSGDDVPASLTHLGVNVSFLGQSDLATGDLSKYDAILLGVRTYAARDDLRVYNNRMLDYVKNGGVVIVQYNTPEFDHNYGPYPYTMTSNPEEVTDEASQVQILDPQNPVFTWPNKISIDDFKGYLLVSPNKILSEMTDAQRERFVSDYKAGGPAGRYAATDRIEQSRRRAPQEPW